MKNLYFFVIGMATSMFAYTQSVPQLLEMNFFQEEITSCIEGEKEVIDCGVNRLTIGEPPAGNGIEEDPFLVVNFNNLIWIWENPPHWDKFYLQMEDIDAAESEYWFGGTGWMPVGTDANPFTGTYDGNNKVISGLIINRDTPLYQGFFGWNNGVVKNLGIVDAHITDNGSRAGILVGLNNTGSVDNCFSTGLIETSHQDGRIGGLVGWNNSSITNSWSSADVNGSNGIVIGGLAGANNEGTVINCYATGNVNGGSRTGGLLGSTQISGLVENSFASGNVSSNNNGGGLIGYSYASTILNCYASGRVVINPYGYYGGALVGAVNTGSIVNSYGLGTVYSFFINEHMMGGLIGAATDAEISASYWNVETSGLLSSIGGTPAVTQQMITQSFYEGWDFDNTWQITENETYPYFIYQDEPFDCNYPPLVLAPGNIMATPYDSQILLEWQAPSMGAHVGFKLYRDDILIQVLNAASVHYLDENVENFKYHTYHISAIYGTNEESLKLKVKVFATPGIAVGEGSEENPYRISDWMELFTVRQEPAARYLQVEDIDLAASVFNEDEGWLPIGDYIIPFTGKYDGGGFTISNLYINKPDTGPSKGFFGYINNAGITRVHLVDVYIVSDAFSYSSCGGLVGDAYYSIISDCSVTGNICTKWNFTGGLVGYAQNSDISGCYSNVSVGCHPACAGGLIGRQVGGLTENSYATGTIAANQFSGGLIGWIVAEGTIINSYSKGAVEGNSLRGGLLGAGDGTQIVESSYWDIETSGIETSAGGAGMNTLDMLLQESFNNWDFELTWRIEEGKTYPYLAWQQTPGEHNVSAGWYLLSTKASPHGAGTVTGSGVYSQNDQVMVSANAFDGFVFEHWLDREGNEISNQSEFYFTMPDDHVLFTAVFSIVSQTDKWSEASPYVFPNPFSDIIKIKNASSVKQVVLTNIFGQVLLQRSLSGSETDIIFTQDLPSGIYLILLMDENNTRKVVKMVKW